MEIGALMVGKIVNHHKAYTSIDVFRGQEKGYFAFGGSSILLLFQPGTVAIDRDIMRNTALDVETRVRMGEAIGQAMTANEMNPKDVYKRQGLSFLLSCSPCRQEGFSLPHCLRGTYKPILP